MPGNDSLSIAGAVLRVAQSCLAPSRAPEAPQCPVYRPRSDPLALVHSHTHLGQSLAFNLSQWSSHVAANALGIGVRLLTRQTSRATERQNPALSEVTL